MKKKHGDIDKVVEYVFSELSNLTRKAANIQSGCISYTPNVASITGIVNIPTTSSRPKVTTCKNCGAPLHNAVCEYCGTEY